MYMHAIITQTWATSLTTYHGYHAAHSHPLGEHYFALLFHYTFHSSMNRIAKRGLTTCSSFLKRWEIKIFLQQV